MRDAVREVREILRVRGAVEAELVRGLLEAYEIGVTLDLGPPPLTPAFAFEDAREVRVLVRSEDADMALEVLTSHRQAGFVVVSRGDGP